jgi:hypothetical protein
MVASNFCAGIGFRKRRNMMPGLQSIIDKQISGLAESSGWISVAVKPFFEDRHMRVIVFALAGAVLSAPLAAQTKLTADDIIARYVKTVGGADKIQAVNTIRRVGRFTGDDGFQAIVIEESTRPNKVREEFSVQGMTAINAYDGANGWKIDPFGGKKDAEALSEAELRSIGKRGAVKHNEGVLTIEHPTWMKSVGTEYVRLSEVIAEQLVLLAASNQNQVDQSELSLLTEMVMGMAPKDHVEMMLATQMASVHLMAMQMATRLRREAVLQKFDLYARQTNQLMRTFTAQAETLKRYRTGGKQVVKVKHVHVHEGAQAIVGNVTKGGGGE